MSGVAAGARYLVVNKWNCKQYQKETSFFLQYPPSSPSKVGFRQTEVLGSRLIHNGRPIMLRGVNRHEFDPRRGKALTKDDMIKDVVAMKRVIICRLQGFASFSNDRETCLSLHMCEMNDLPTVWGSMVEV